MGRKVLVTGGAGFVGANLARRARARAIPTGRSSRSTTSTAAARSSTCRGCARPASSSSTATCASPTTCCALGRGRRARRVLGRAVGAGGRRRRHRLRGPDQPGRRLQLPRAGPPRRRAARLPLDQPRLSRRGARRRSRSREAETRFELARRAGAARASRRAGIAEDFPLDGARTLYGATKLAAELLIAEYARRVRPAARSIDRCGVIAGPWQMGKVDQGVFTLLAARPPLRARR